MNKITISIDLKADLENYLREKLQKDNLKKMGVNASSFDLDKIKEENFENLIAIYSRLHNRLSIGRKRKVVMLKSLLADKKFAKYKNEISNLKRLFENGSSIRPFLSNSVNKVYFVDKLLLDWGINHLHFTSCYSKKKRGNDILFIIEHDEVVYFIAIMTHSDFYNIDLLKYIYENHPAILEPYKMVGIPPLTHNYTFEQIRDSRNFDVGYCISFDDNTYAPRLNKNSNTSLIVAQLHLKKALERAEQTILEKKDTIIKQIYNYVVEYNISLKWIINNNSTKLQLYDTKNNVMYLIDLDGPNLIKILEHLNVI